MSDPKNSFRYKELSPAPALASHVLNFWTFRTVSLSTDGYEHHVPPDGCVSLLVRYSGNDGPPKTLMVGPRADTFTVKITTCDQYFGVRFWPHTALPLLGRNLERSINFVGPAGLMLPKLAASIMTYLPLAPDEQTVLDAMQTQIGHAGFLNEAIDEVVQSAVAMIVLAEGNCRMQGIADDVNVSLRQLQRRFRAASGLTPKQFARLCRFRKAAKEMLRQRPRTWVDVAYDAGFADQSHLSREFSQLIGLTAEELRRKHDDIEHEGPDF